MFKREVKVKFNQQKFMQLSTMSTYRLAPNLVHNTGHRVAALFGLSFAFILIKYQRKAHTHKVCYTPLRHGLEQVKSDHEYGPIEKMGVYGRLPATDGRIKI